MGKSKPKQIFKDKSEDLSKNHGTTKRYRVRKQQEKETDQQLRQFLKEPDAGKEI